jgi:hypothetical protein
MKTLMSVFLILFSFTSIAGSTGYIYEGKTYFLYKDGVELNESPIEKKSVGSRAPASVLSSEKTNDSMILYFTEDEVARCYYWAPKKQGPKKQSKNIHCMPKSKL